VWVVGGAFVGVLGCMLYGAIRGTGLAAVAISFEQFLQVSISVFAGSVLSLWVHRQATAHDRVRDISVRALEAVETRLATAYEAASDYFNAPAKNKEPRVICSLKTLSVFISLLDIVDTRRTGIDLNQTMESLGLEYLKLKATITGGRFGSPANKISESQISDMESSHSAIYRSLLKAKFNVYLR
jgi:hypothetical protein